MKITISHYLNSCFDSILQNKKTVIPAAYVEQMKQVCIDKIKLLKDWILNCANERTVIAAFRKAIIKAKAILFLLNINKGNDLIINA